MRNKLGPTPQAALKSWSEAMKCDINGRMATEGIYGRESEGWKTHLHGLSTFKCIWTLAEQD